MLSLFSLNKFFSVHILFFIFCYLFSLHFLYSQTRIDTFYRHNAPDGPPVFMNIVTYNKNVPVRGEQYPLDNLKRLMYRWDAQNCRAECFHSDTYFMNDSAAQIFVRQCPKFVLYIFDYDENHQSICHYQNGVRCGPYEYYYYENLPHTFDANGPLYPQDTLPMGAWTNYKNYPRRLLMKGQYNEEGQNTGIWYNYSRSNDNVPELLWYISLVKGRSVLLSLTGQILPMLLTVLAIFFVMRLALSQNHYYFSYYLLLIILLPLVIFSVFAGGTLMVCIMCLSVYNLFGSTPIRHKVLSFVILLLMVGLFFLLIAMVGLSSLGGAMIGVVGEKVLTTI